MKLFKALIFLAKFQFAVTRRFFTDGFWKDYGSIEAAFISKTYLKKYAAEMEKVEAELDKMLSRISKESKDETRPKFNAVPKGSDRLN